MLNKFLSLFKRGAPRQSEETRADAVKVLTSPLVHLSGKDRRAFCRLRFKDVGHKTATAPKLFMVKFTRKLRSKTASQLIKMRRRQNEEYNIGRRQHAKNIAGILKGILPDPSPVLKMFAAQLTAIENEMLGRGMLLTI